MPRLCRFIFVTLPFLSHSAEVITLTTIDPLTEIHSSSLHFKPEQLFTASLPTPTYATCVRLLPEALPAFAKHPPSAQSLDAFNCSVTPAHSDRTTFRAVYNVTSALPPVAPTVTSAGGSASPVVIDFVLANTSSPTFKEATFTLLYNCASAPPAVSVLTLTFSADQHISWGKSCGAGAAPYLEVSYLPPSGDLTPLTGDPVKIPPMTELTELHLALTPPALAQTFGPVTLKTSDPKILTAKARGIARENTLFVGLFSVVSIMFECHQFAKATVDVAIALPPWNSLTATFVKDCGGSYPAFLSVGTSPIGDDIIARGVARRAGTAVTPKTAAKPILIVPESEHTLDLFIRHTGALSDGPLHFSDPVVTVADAHVMRVSTTGHIGNTLWSHGGVLEGGEAFDLTLRFSCHRQGQTTATVSFPLLRYRTVEFEMTKKCGVPTVHQEASFYNVGGVEHFVIAAVVLGAVITLACLRLRNAAVAEPKYERVSVSR